MKSFIILSAIALTTNFSSQPAQKEPPTKQIAMLCFKTGERTSGINKICYYDCGGSAAAITVGGAELCPLSINS